MIQGEAIQFNISERSFYFIVLFSATSNGLQDSLNTYSKQCTIVLRIHVCHDEEECSLSLCSTFGRNEGFVIILS